LSKLIDVLYKVDIKGEKAYIYILMDHKSYPDKAVSFQLLNYKYLIWERVTGGKRSWKNLPMVIPVVFYHGKEKWNVHRNFSNIIDNSNESLNKYVINYEYILCDLSDYSDEEIIGDVLIQLGMFTFKHIFDSQNDWQKLIPKLFKVLDDLSKHESGLSFLSSFLKYFMSEADLDSQTVKDVVIETFSEPGGKTFMTAAEELKLIGRAEGELEAKEKIAKTMLVKGSEKEFISEVTGLSLEEIEKLNES